MSLNNLLAPIGCRCAMVFGQRNDGTARFADSDGSQLRVRSVPSDGQKTHRRKFLLESGKLGYTLVAGNNNLRALNPRLSLQSPKAPGEGNGTSDNNHNYRQRRLRWFRFRYHAVKAPAEAGLQNVLHSPFLEWQKNYAVAPAPNSNPSQRPLSRGS